MTNTFSDSTDSSHEEASWSEIRDSIFACEECLRELSTVKVIKKRLDTFVDPNKPTKVRLLFVSEAPPGGKNLGDFQSILSEMRNPRAFWGALISLSLSYGLRIFFTQDTVQTAEFIYTLTRQTPFKRGVRPLVIGKPRMESIMEAQIAVVESLPGIGPVLAERLLRQFGTVRKIFMASATELAVKGRIGKARANKIFQFLDLQHEVARAKSTQARLGLG